MRRLMIFVALTALAAPVACTRARGGEVGPRAGPAPREYPATPTESIAIASVEVQANQWLQARYAEIVADVRRRLELTDSAVLRYDPERRVFLVDAAPVTSSR